MKYNKLQWINFFRVLAEEKLPTIERLKTREQKSKAINQLIKNYLADSLENIKSKAKKHNWKKEEILHEILLVTYASYIVMLEYRNKVWPYEYMAFARRIGELWEPFCKIPFEHSICPLDIIEPYSFKLIHDKMRKDATDYISCLSLSEEVENSLINYYDLPWSLVDSGGIKMELDLHFHQMGINYSCDFTSGFSSNEKGNTNRLLLVGSIYHSLDSNEKTILFVRQEESQNNHYFQSLKKSSYWECFCANSCYEKIAEFTGFNLRAWMDENIDWYNDISSDLKHHLEENNLVEYLTW